MAGDDKVPRDDADSAEASARGKGGEAAAPATNAPMYDDEAVMLGGRGGGGGAMEQPPRCVAGRRAGVDRHWTRARALASDPWQRRRNGVGPRHGRVAAVSRTGARGAPERGAKLLH